MRGAIVLGALALSLTTPSVRAQSSAERCAPVDIDALAGWNGIWAAEDLVLDISGRFSDRGAASGNDAINKLFGGTAPWNDAGWARFEAVLRMAFAGQTLQYGWGYPMMMNTVAPFKFVIAPGETVIASQYRELRYVYTDGRPHPSDDALWPTIWGDSIGCWEGDTLVVDTVSVKYTPEFNHAGPPLSDRAHFVERIRMVGPDRMENRFTITDPVLLESPWEVTVFYERHPVLRRMVHESDINAYNRIVDGENGLTIAAPRARPSLDEPSFPPEVVLSAAELDRFVGKYPFDDLPLTLMVERRRNRLFTRVEPANPWFLPVYAADAQTFYGRVGGVSFRFEADSDGDMRFTGTAPTGEPISGRRVAD